MRCYVSATFSDVGTSGRARVKRAHRCGEKFDVWLLNAPLLQKNTHRKELKRRKLRSGSYLWHYLWCKFIGYEEAERVPIGLVKTKTNTKVPPAAWETTWESKAQSAMLRLSLSPRVSHLWLDSPRTGWKTPEAGPHCVQKLNSAATLRIKSVLQLVLETKKGFNQRVLECQIN